MTLEYNLPVKANLRSEVKVLIVPKRGELEDPFGFHSAETHCGLLSPSAVRQTSGQTLVHILSPFIFPPYNRVKALT